MIELREPVAGKTTEPCRMVKICRYPMRGVEENPVLLLPMEVGGIVFGVEYGKGEDANDPDTARSEIAASIAVALGCVVITHFFTVTLLILPDFTIERTRGISRRISSAIKSGALKEWSASS